MEFGSSREDLDRLRRSVDWALRQSIPVDELVGMLNKLARVASPDSEHFLFAHRQLAEALVELDPWRAALCARRVVEVDSSDDRAWALLALAYTVLGHYRSAALAYRRALAITPDNPWYAHNLGHMIDVALNRPADSLTLLASSFRSLPKESEVASSYALALARSGRVAEAEKILRPFVKRGATDEQKALLDWIKRGAPPLNEVTSSAERLTEVRQPRRRKRAAQAENKETQSKRAGRD